jgi:ElaB/YqjD/DUF883 family membrane-anchored ribosome-binding protein
MGKKPGEVKQEVDQTRAEVDHDLKSLNDEVKQQGGAKGVAKNQMKTELKSASTKAKKELKSAPQKAKTAKKKVTKHPVASVAAAAGAGLLARTLSKSSRRNSKSQS